MNDQHEHDDSVSPTAARSAALVLLLSSLCVLFIILFLIVFVVVLSLIAVYIPAKNINSVTDTTDDDRTINTMFSTGLTDTSAVSIEDTDSLVNQMNQNLSISPLNNVLTIKLASFIDDSSKKRKRKRNTRAINCDFGTNFQGDQANINTYISNYPSTVCTTKYCRQNFRNKVIENMRLKFNQINFVLKVKFSNGTIANIPIQFCSIVDNDFGYSQPGLDNDILVLNYLLYLTNLQNTLYTRYQNQYSQSNFLATGYPNPTYADLNTIQSQAQAHVILLNQLITARGGTPVTVCNYQFSTVTNVSSYINVALKLEQIIINAYIGVISGFTDAVLIRIATQIANVDARHEAYLTFLVDQALVDLSSPGTTSSVGVSDTLVAIANYISSCPYTLQRPLEVLPGAFIFNGTVPAPSSVIVNYSRPMYDNDLRILQVALYTGQLIIALYSQSSKYLTTAPYTSYQSYFDVLLKNEQAHVAYLQQTIQNRLATPNPACTYTFSNNITDGASFLQYASFIENLQASVYSYTANGIVDPGVLTPLAVVYTEEAKHAAYTNILNNISAFPDSINSIVTVSAAITALAPNQKCSFTLSLPVLPYIIVVSATSLPS